MSAYFSDDENNENENDSIVPSDEEDDGELDMEGGDEEYEDVPDEEEPTEEVIANILNPLNEDNDDEEDDEDEDENYLQKFNKEIHKNYVIDFHPECAMHNQQEIEALSRVVRNLDDIIIDDLHKTLPFLTKFERARILGQRAKQINSGSPPFVKIPDKIMDGYAIAELELAEKAIPFIIRRPLLNGASEYWRVQDLENILF
jgi:DNA-directed RNA polymerase I, II, and III subunit RPABC2